MVRGLDEVLREARRRGRAAPGFSCYDLATGAGALAAAQAAGTPVVLIVSVDAFRAPTGAALVAGLRVLAERAEVPAAVQLDHVDDLATIEAALHAGANVIMADGSSRPYAANVALVRAAVDLARPHGAQVEAELGALGGDEEHAQGTAPAGMTDPAQVAGFVAESGADCLAVAIGNVHGRYLGAPALDWHRLDAIARECLVPLSLHGASGLPAGDLRRAAAAGIAKVNVNTALRAAWLACAAGEAGDYADGARLLAFQERLAGAMGDVAAVHLQELAG